MKKIFILLILILSTKTLWCQLQKVNNDYIDYLPIPQPKKLIIPPENFSAEREVLIYNIEEKKQTKHKAFGETPLIKYFEKITSYNKNYDSICLGDDLDNFTNFQLVSDPSVFPWCVNCKLKIEFVDENGVVLNFSGSGILIDSKHVLTAGHCIYRHEVGNYNINDWAQKVTVIPGYSTNNEPYGTAEAISLLSWNFWINFEFQTDDMGIIELDRHIGSLTGWHAYGYETSSSFFLNNTFENPGYPYGPYSGSQQYTRNGTYDNVTTYIAYFNKVGYPGHSGSGSWNLNNNVYTVYAEHSHTTPSNESGHVLITPGKYSDIFNFIDDHTPSNLDLIPLDVNVEPSIITAGNTLTYMDYLVHNYSYENWSGTVNVSVYLSTDDIISANDILLNNHTFSHNFTAKSSLRVLFPPLPTIPNNILTGDYYIGIILNINDACIGNNYSDFQDAAPIYIEQLPDPTLTDGQVNPANGPASTPFEFKVTYNYPGNPYVDPDYVDVVIDGSSYQMQEITSDLIQVEFGNTAPAGAFSIGQHEYYFEGQQGNTYMRYPNQPGSTLSFEVTPENPSGLTLSLNPNPALVNQEVTVSAQLNPPVSGHPVNFFQIPNMGYFSPTSNPVLTDQNGVATKSYYPISQGTVDITAVDATNSTINDTEALTIQQPSTNISITVQSSRYGEQNNQVLYDVLIWVYNNGQPYYNYDVTFQTDLGVWTNGQPVHTFFSQGTYIQSDRLYCDCPVNQTANISITVENATVYYPLVVQCPIPPLNPSVTYNAPGAMSLSFKPNDDKIAFNTNTSKIKVYDISEGQVVQEYTFTDPSNGNEVPAYIVRYSPDGSKIFIGSEWGSRILSTSTGASLAQNANLEFYPDPEWTGDVKWANNTYIMACNGFSNPTNGIFRSSNLTLYKSILNSNYMITEVDVKGGYAVASEGENELHSVLFNSSTWNQIRIYDPPGNGDHTACAISPDGSKTLVHDGYDYIIYLYNNSNGNEINNFSDYSYAWSFEWNPVYTDYVAGLHGYNKIIIWDVTNGSQFLNAQNVNEYGDLCWSSDGEILASVSGGYLKIFAPFDFQPPEISINTPQNNFETIEDHITLSGVITDDTEVSHAEYKVNSGSWTSLSLNPNNEFNVVVNLLPGSNTLSVRAFDIYGKTSTKTITGTRLTDQEPPNIYNVSASPEEVEIGDPIAVVATVQDGWSGVNPTSVVCMVETPYTELYLNYPMTSAGNNLFTTTVSTQAFQEGDHIIHISAEDMEGNSDTLMNAAVFLPYDLPQIAEIIVSPDTIYTTDPITIQCKITDQSGIINVALRLDDDPNLPSPIGYNMTMVNDSIFMTDIPPHSEGFWFFIIEAMDEYGKENQSPVQGFEIISLFQPVVMQLSAFLEGPFDGNLMNTYLNSSGYIPLSQPFNTPPWNYSGTESVISITNPDIVDWILVELRETSGGPETASNGTVVARKAVFILKDGTITDVDESGFVDFGSKIITENLYVTIWHRNHLGIISNYPVTESGGIYTYVFYDNENKVYGGPIGHKEINGTWVMISGDGDANMTVNNNDKIDVWSVQAGNSGYYSGDYDANGQVANPDKIEKWAPNAGKSSQVPTNSAPTAVFSVTPSTGTTSTIFNFDASASFDPEDPVSVLQVRWDWENDGVWDTPYSTAKTATYQYVQTGTYTVKLQVKDSGGLTGSATDMVEVTSANQAPLPPSNPSPSNGATDQSVNITLSWTCSDPENDPLTYDVYLGQSNPPPLNIAGQTSNTYGPLSLDYNATYYWKIVAHDDHTNTTEGPVWSFTTEAQSWQCGDDYIDPRDGQVYSTVLIGSQCWMAENLNMGTMINGSTNQTNNGIIEKYCYANNSANCDEYGGLYKWDEMMEYVTTPGIQGICPADWHIPTDEEWKQLEGEVDSQFDYPNPEWNQNGWRGLDAGGSLKETGTTHWQSPNTGATNSSGFTALPAGGRDPNGNFGNLTSHGILWSSSGGNTALSRTLHFDYAQSYRYDTNKENAISIRCLRD